VRPVIAYCTKVLDGTLDGIATEVSPPGDWASLASASEILVQARVTSLLAPSPRKIDLWMETSAEGTDWALLWTDVFVVDVGVDANLFFSVSSLLNGEYMRVGAFLRPDAGDASCRIELWISGRARRAHEPAEDLASCTCDDLPKTPHLDVHSSEVECQGCGSQSPKPGDIEGTKESVPC